MRTRREIANRSLMIVLAVTAVTAVAAAQPPRARVRLPGYSAVIALDSLAVFTDLPAPPAEVFPVAAAALELELKIELKTRDSTAGLVGNLELVKMRSLGGSPLSRYLSCGSGMTGPNADSYRIYLAIMAFVDPLPDNKTRLGVALAAGAQDVQGNAKLPVPCGSSGALEARVRRAVAARFGVAVRQ
jgi:hypothetical protein